MGDFLSITLLLLLAWPLWMVARALMPVLIWPLNLVVVPGQYLAGEPSNWELARGRFVLGTAVALTALACAGTAFLTLCVGLVYFFRTRWPDLPAWLIWLFGVGLSVGVLLSMSRSVATKFEKEEAYQGFAATAIAWTVFGFCAPVIFGVLAFWPATVHSQGLAWIPYSQYAPGLASSEFTAGDPYRGKLLAILGDLQSADEEEKKKEAEFHPDSFSERGEAVKAFAALTRARADLGEPFRKQLMGITPPPRLQEFHALLLAKLQKDHDVMSRATDFLAAGDTAKQEAYISENREAMVEAGDRLIAEMRKTGDRGIERYEDLLKEAL